ncbi:MAG: hypothetical protein M3X11_18310 [Acidobacteriota bacterium]|nr:hypothetical protein [Acidobacteriota bacterium]
MIRTSSQQQVATLLPVTLMKAKSCFAIITASMKSYFSRLGINEAELVQPDIDKGQLGARTQATL